MTTNTKVSEVQNFARLKSVSDRQTVQHQKKTFDLLKGLKWGEIQTILRSLHPLDELQQTMNLSVSMTSIDRDGLIKFFETILEEYIEEKISFQELKDIARYHSDMLFQLSEEQGVDKDKVFFSSETKHEIVEID